MLFRVNNSTTNDLSTMATIVDRNGDNLSLSPVTLMSPFLATSVDEAYRLRHYTCKFKRSGMGLLDIAQLR